MPQIISDSPDIATLDFKVVVDECTGVFTVDVSPTVFIGSGAANALGASVKIENVSRGTTTKDYPTSGYDIVAPMTGTSTTNIPTIAGSYQFGNYDVTVSMTDSNGKVYEIKKTVNLCAAVGSKGKKYGSLSAMLTGNCKTSELGVVADIAPNYANVEPESQINAFTLEYPTHSTLPPLSSPLSNFKVNLYEGVYLFSGSSCVTYNSGDNVFYQVKYNFKKKRNIRCNIDSDCISARIRSLIDQSNSDCSFIEKQETQETVVNALLLLKAIELLADSGFDYSDYIDQLEDILGCTCTCNCSEGSPVNPGSGSGGNVTLTGCNVTATTVGNTTNYQIDNYDYEVSVAANGGAVTITSAVLDGCTKKQTITLNIATLYNQIKAQVNKQTEWDFWASTWKKSINGIDPSCLGLTQSEFIALSAKDFMQLLVTLGCEGGVCNGVILNDRTTKTGGNTNILWDIEALSGVYETAIYIDGILEGTVLAPANSFELEGGADGNLHNYDLVAKCSNGSIGNSIQGQFTYSGCPTIAPPTLSSGNVANAACPYDLTSLVVGTPPIGIVYEWHNFNNTLSSTIVANPNSVQAGSYFLFAKDSGNCYSIGVQVNLSCSVVTNCSAPQGLVIDVVGNGTRVRFQPASYPPPSNSYSVKRRVASSADIEANYTSVGTPTWNASVNKWEIIDNTFTANVLYVYKAISNCSSSAPFITGSFANMTCPAFVVTSESSNLSVSLLMAPTQLTALISGGVPPYIYSFSVTPTGPCEAHSFANASGTTSATSAVTDYTAIAYSGTTYVFVVTVSDSTSASATSNTVTRAACLTPDTDVELKDGSSAKIIDLKVGDELGEGNKVEQKQDRVVDELYVVNGGLLKSSKGHLHIIVHEGEEVQIAATNLKEGMFYKGKEGLVEITNIEVQEGEFDVVDIATSTGTYWANGILTHNKVACP